MAIKTYNKNNPVKLSENFNSKEFACKGKGCCSTVKIDSKLVEYLQQIRAHFNKPITITSGYRCPTHNKKVGGATGSRHAKGQAADIQVKDIAPREVAKYAESLGIKGIGLYETAKDGYFVHVDTRTNKSFWYGQKQAYRSTFGGNEIPVAEKKEEETAAGSPVATFKCGDVVRLIKGAKYTNGVSCPSWLLNCKLYVRQIKSNGNIVFSTQPTGATTGTIKPEYLTLQAATANNEYKIKITANSVNVRAGNGTRYKILDVAKKNEEYIVIKESNGWGQLKTGGWISLKYSKKI